MSKPRYIKPAGQIRRSQLLTTYGPGALIEMPKHSALVGGLDHWTPVGEQILEKRLVEKLKRALGRPDVTLCSPPPANDDPTAPPTSVTVWQFPEWFIVQELRSEHSDEPIRRRQLVHRSSLTSGRYFIDRDKQRRDVVPVRFVRACLRGHISDIDWGAFIHGRESTCLNVPRGWNDTTHDNELVLRFARDFQQHEWPGQKLPEVFYDPRSLDTSSNKRTSLHAKCIVIDDQLAFISSANFTEAAQSRNIEVGVLLRSPASAIQLVTHFDELIATGVLLPLPWPCDPAV